MNTPGKKYSVYQNWKPITHYELYKFLTVIVQISLDPKPQIRDYWDKSDKGYSPWYSQMFDRNRFQAIFHTMLHCSEADSEGKEKVEPFMNMLLERFQAAYYPKQHLALVGWTASLIEFLNTKKTYFTGTLNIMRAGFPPQLKTLKLQHMGASWYFSEDNKILCVTFKDKKAKKLCVLVTNKVIFGHGTKTVQPKPRNNQAHPHFRVQLV
ncbi:PiggyBac transposable element-derived protein [Plakobranchus ocellatus]|uniref:PiggyBac transposable element-derived protein n=1 Tax=Plakobranchus ocellatus TaxID=259542 RepID=A0AAV4D1Y3_9GAST|nr:PiggyBac transposable element-derived protein [Plakobranchus ocellatus]